MPQHLGRLQSLGEESASFMKGRIIWRETTRDCFEMTCGDGFYVVGWSRFRVGWGG